MHGSRFNLPRLKKYRQALRNNCTQEEAELWKYLRGRQLRGQKFRRQFSIDNMIVDFYCPNLRIAIELDGSQHREEHYLRHDAVRDDELQSEFGITVLRFSNAIVWSDISAVISEIEDVIDMLSEKKNSPPPGGGD